MKTLSDYFHIPVLLKESIEFLNTKNKKNSIFIDATLGLGGHTEEILKNIAPDSKVIGIDCDYECFEIAKARLKNYKNFYPVRNNFKNIDLILDGLKIKEIDGILFDLGISSLHFEKADRGFSFVKEANLDMRLDRDEKLTAFEIVNYYAEEEIAAIIKNYGEDRDYKKIAHEIVKSRPITTTFALSNIIKRVKKGKKEKINPATRVFQALRIAVNNELENLKIGLEKSIKFLKKDGRIVVISFHSLEDKIVKNFFKKESQDCICVNKKLPCVCGHKKVIKVLTKKPVMPSEDELVKNPRSRSAKLRAAEKIV